MEVRAVVLLALIAGATSSPVVRNSRKCSTECIESTKLKYEPGTVYEYQYEADTLTTVQGSAEEHSSVHIKATAVIEAQSQCELILRLRDVTLEEADPRDIRKRTKARNSNSFSEALQSNPLVFSFQNGRIQQLCGSEYEPAWVMNVKRGVLSAFQNSMEHMEHDHSVSETDVAGNCQVQYKIAERSYNRLSISKSKNLLGCTDRQHHLSAFQGNAYRVPSEIQSLPLMKSTHDCEQTINIMGHLEKSECHENHVFRPFSKQVNGASTKVTQKVRFLRRHNRIQNAPASISQRLSMLFDHMKPETGTSAEVREAENILKAICKHQDSRPESAQQFSQLIAHLRTLDYYNIRDLHQRVHSSRVCEDNHERAKIFFNDAIPMVSTSGALGIARDLIKKGEVAGTKADAWMTTIAFIAKPTLEMLKEIKPLLENNPRQQTVLSISTLVNSYCRHNSECSFESEVQDIVNNFLNVIGRQCSGEHDRVLLALKALGNAGAAVIDVNVLNQCVNSKADMETRVAAINAYRRLPCSRNNDELMRLLKDSEEDSEARIAAYLSIMRCPTKEIFTEIRTILQTEEINQVGSFIWTHLTNLKETSDPLKQEIRKILEEEPLKREFNMDQRKFSRNYEGSVFLNSINTGAQVESNMIWSPKSYIPRSAMFNLTVDMFGQSVNLLELGGRVEGMEKALESLFGPDGYFKENKVADLIKRKKRSASDPISVLRDSFDAKAEDSAKASMYIKMFGNELGYFDNHNFDWQKQKDSINFLEILIKLATDHKVDFSKSAQFLDTSTSIPTILGLPLKMSIKGTATVDVHISGHADLRKIATKPRSLDVKGYIKPSGAVEIVGLMGVDVAGMTSGLKMTSTLHSSTSVDGTVTFEEGKTLGMRFNMPEDKVDILNVETKFFVVGGHGVREQKMIQADRTEKKLCSGFMLQKALGVKVCGEVSLPSITSKEDAPFYPFTGPTTLKAYILKTDTHGAYTVDFALQKPKTGNIIIAKAGFNTPGSKIDRDFGLEFELKPSANSIDFDMRSPWKKVSISGSLTNKKLLKAGSLSLVLDKKREYSISGDVKLDERPAMVKYTPSVQIRIPGRKDATFKGYIQYKKNKRMDVDMALSNVFKKPVNLKGAVSIMSIKSKVKYTANLVLNSQFITVKTNGFLDKAGKRSVSRVIIAYTVPGKKLQRFVVNTKFRDLSNKAAARRNMNIAFQTSQFPDYNSQITIDLAKTTKRITTSMDLKYGPNWKDLKKRIYFQTVLNYGKKGKTFFGDYNMKLSYKAQSIDVKSKGDFRHSEEESKALATIQYKPGRLIKYSMGLKRDTKKPIRINANVALSYPGRQMAISSELIERAANNFHHEFIVQWQKQQSFKTMSVYTRKGTDKHDFRSEISLPKMRPITIIGNAVLNKKDFEAKAQVQYNTQTYASGVSYSYDLGKKPIIKAAIDIKHPSRQVTADTELGRVGNNYRGRVDVKWDADKDASRRLLIDGAVLYAFKKDVSLKIKYPGRLISANVNHLSNSKTKKTTSHAELTWAPNKKVSIDHSYSLSNNKAGFSFDNNIRFESPIDKFENIKASSSLVNNEKQLAGKGTVSWKPGKELTTNLAVKKINGWNNFNGQLTVKTPFESMKIITSNVNHKFTKTALASDADFSWNKNKVELGISGKALSFKQKTTIEGSVELKTPFKYFKDVAVRTDNTVQRDQVNSHIETEWNDRKYLVDVFGKRGEDMEGKIRLQTPVAHFNDVSVSGKFSTSGNKIVNSLDVSWAKGKSVTFSGNMLKTNSPFNVKGEAKISTPFSGYERMALSWEHNFSLNKVNLLAKMTGSFKPFLLNIDGSHQNSYYSRDLNGHIVLKSPIPGMEDIDVTLKHHIGENDMKTELDAVYQRINNIEMLIEGDITDAIIGKVTLKTPFKSLREIGAHVNARTKNPFNGHIELQWAPTKKVALDGEVTLQGLKYGKGEVRFTSPFAGLERIIVNGHHTSNNNGFTVIASTEYAPGKKIEVRTNFNNEKGVDAELVIKSPCPYFKEVAITTKHSGNLQNFNNEIKFVYDGEDEITYFSKLRAKGFSLINGNLKLTSPFKYVKDVSAKISHRKQGLQWTSNLEVAPSPRNKIIVESKLQTENGIKVEMNLKTPFNMLRQFMLDVEHNGKGSHFDNKGSLELIYGRDRISYTSTLTVAGPSYIVGSAKFISTKGDIDYSINLRHNKNGNEWVSHAEIGLDGHRKITVDSTFENSKQLKLSSSLMTPFNSMRRVSAMFEHSRDADNLNTKMEIECSKFNGKIKAEIVGHKQDSNYDGHILFTSPFEGMEKMRAEIDHTLSERSQYTTRAGLEYKRGQKIILSSTVNAPSLKQFDVSANLKTPFYPLQTASVSYKHRGDASKLNCHAEMQYNNEMKSSMDLAFDQTDAISGSLMIKSPFQYTRDVQMSFNHEGTLAQFKTNGEIVYNGKKIESVVTLKTRQIIKFNAMLKTPFEGLETSTVSLEHTGNRNAFETHVVGTYGQKTIRSDVSFNSNRGIDATIDVTTPFTQLKKGHFKVHHEGELKAFSSNLELAYNNKKIHYEQKFNAVGKLEALVSLTTPCKFLQDVEVSLKHQGTLKAFESNLQATYNKEKVFEINANFNTRGEMQGSLRFASIIQNLEELSLSFRHQGNMKNFRSHAELTYAPSKTIMFDARLNTQNKIEGLLQLRSPFKNFENIFLSLDHQGGMKDFTCQCEFSYAKGKAIKLNGNFGTTNGITGDFKLTTPFTTLDTLNVAFNHKGSPADFESTAEISYNNNEAIQLSVEFSHNPNIAGKIQFRSPFEGFTNWKFVFNHRQSYNSFVFDTTLTAEGKNELAIDVNLQKQPFQAIIKIKMPPHPNLYRNLQVIIKNKGSVKSFDTHAELRYLDGTILYKGKLDFTKNVEGEFTLKTPHTKDLSVSFNQNSDDRHVVSGQVSYGSQRVQLNAELQKDFSEGRIHFTSPVEQIDDLAASYKHNGDGVTFRTNAEFVYRKNKKISLDADLTMDPTMSGTVRLQTPFEELRDVSFTAGQDSSRANMAVTYNNNKYSLNVERRGRQTRLHLVSPDERINMIMSHRINNKMIVGDLKINRGGKNLITVNVDLRNFAAISGHIELKSALKQLKHIELNLKHQGNMDAFQSQGDISYANKKVSGSIDWKTKPALNLVAQINTPFEKYEHMSLNLNHEASGNGFVTTTKFGYSPSKEIEVVAKMNTGVNSARGTLQVTTPITNYENFKVSFNHAGPINNFHTNAEAVYGRKRFVTDVVVDVVESKEIKATIMTPYENFNEIVLSGKASGEPYNFQTDVSLKYAPRKVISLKNSFKTGRRSMEGTLSFTTPFSQLKTLRAEFQHRGDLTAFDTNGFVMYGREKLEVNSNYNSENGMPRSGKLFISSTNPLLQKMGADFTVAKSEGEYESKASATWAPGKVITISTNLNKNFRRYNKDIDASVKITTPFEKAQSMVGKYTYSQSSNIYSGMMSAELNNRNIFNIDGKYENKYGKRSAILNMRSPKPSSISADLENNKVNFNLNLDTRSSDKNLQISAGYNGIHDMNARIATPSRATSFTTLIQRPGKKVMHKYELVWDEANQKKILIEGALNDLSRGSQRSFEMNGKIVTPIRSMAANFDHSCSGISSSNALSIQWDSERNPEKKMTLKSAYQKRGEMKTLVITIGHPQMQQDIMLKNELAVLNGNTIFHGLTELKYTDDARDNIVLSADLDKVPTDGFNYNFNMKMVHQKSLMDSSISANIANTPRAMSADLKVNYLTTRRRTENLVLMAQIDKLRKSLKAQLITPLKEIELTGNALSKGPKHTFSIQNTIDRRSTVKAIVQVNSNTYDSDLKVYYDPESPRNLYHAYIKYATPTKMKFEAYRMHNGKRTTDGQLDMDLKNRRLLHTRLYWRPSMYNDIQSFSSSDLLDSLNDNLYSTNDVASNALRREYLARRYYTVRMIPDLTPVSEYIQAEASSFADDLDSMTTEFNRMVRNNEFFMGDISEAYTATVSYISNKLEKITEALKLKVEELKTKLNEISEKISIAKQALKEKYDDMMEKVAVNYPVYKEKALRKYTEISQKIAEKMIPVMDMYNQVYEQAAAKYSNMVSHHRVRRSVEHFNTMREHYNRIHAWTSDKLSNLDILKPARNVHFNVKLHLRQLNTKLSSYANTVSAHVNKALNKAQEYVNKAADKVTEYEYPKYVKTVMDEVFSKGKVLFDHLNLKDTTHRFAMNAIQTTVKSAKQNAAYLLGSYLHLEKDKVIVYDPKKGVIEFQVYIPVNVPQLKSLPNYHIAEMLNNVKQTVKKYTPTEEYSFWDTFYKYKPSSDMNDWIPPFKSYAVIAGNQHYVTFDKRSFEFAGQCTYLLAADMVNVGSDAVYVNYNNGIKRSLTILSERSRIEIPTDYKVKVDNKQVDLPVQIGTTSIRRVGSELLIEKKSGMSLKCDINNDVCILGISGWFYGKVGGLLGTYDNEPSNDFMTANRRKVESPEELAQSWLVSGSCRSPRNLARVYTPEEGKESFRACAALFHSRRSPLRPCFKVVKPEKFFKICVNDFEESVAGKGGVCKSAAIYVAVCKKEGVPLRMPRPCIKCESKVTDTISEGEEITVQNPMNSADVVFVVEEKKCNKKAVNKLKNMMMLLDRSLRQEGLKNNRYGLVGFGGKGVHEEANTHTMDGQLFGGVRQIIRGIATLNIDDGDNKDVMQALRMAARYPFRVGVSKTVVLLTCSACGENPLVYKEMKRILDNNNIHLHVLRAEEFQISTALKAPTTTDLFGIDSHAAFTSHHVSEKKLTGDKELFTKIVQSSDICSRLAQKTEGSVFNINKLTEGQVKFQKHFIDVFTRRVARSAKPASCQTCECSADATGTGSAICRPCYMPKQTFYSQIFSQSKDMKKNNEDRFDMDYQEYRNVLGLN